MKKVLILIVMMMVIPSMRIMGQEQKDKTTIGGDQPSRYFLGKEEQMLLPVNVLGMVQKPGQYMVPFRTDLVSVIAYAGGFRVNAKINKIKIVRSALSKGKGSNSDGNNGQAKVFEVDVKRYFEEGDLSQIPQLMPDDTIIVAGSAAQTVNRFFDFVTKVTILAQLGFYIAIIVDRQR